MQKQYDRNLRKLDYEARDRDPIIGRRTRVKNEESDEEYGASSNGKQKEKLRQDREERLNRRKEVKEYGSFKVG